MKARITLKAELLKDGTAYPVWRVQLLKYRFLPWAFAVWRDFDTYDEAERFVRLFFKEEITTPLA